MFEIPDLDVSSSSKSTIQLEVAGRKLKEITEKITKVTEREDSVPQDRGDWTNIYRKWGDWEDIEELTAKKALEEGKIETISTRTTDCLGHTHDHSKERLFYESSEETKFKECEKHRAMGNYLFKEGLIEKAVDNYEIAIAYYEYCFPADDAQQKSLDSLRHACLCNASLCYTRLGHLRKAVESATEVIKECKTGHAKAFYRRAQAYRHLDEYKLALNDLEEVKNLRATDKAVMEELSLIKRIAGQHLSNTKEFAKLSLTGSNPIDSVNVYSTDIVAQEFDDSIPIEPVWPQSLWRD